MGVRRYSTGPDGCGRTPGVVAVLDLPTSSESNTAASHLGARGPLARSGGIPTAKPFRALTWWPRGARAEGQPAGTQDGGGRDGWRLRLWLLPMYYRMRAAGFRDVGWPFFPDRLAAISGFADPCLDYCKSCDRRSVRRRGLHRPGPPHRGL